MAGSPHHTEKIEEIRILNTRVAQKNRPYGYEHLPIDPVTGLNFARMRTYVYETGTHVMDIDDLARFYGCLLTTIARLAGEAQRISPSSAASSSRG